MLHFDIHCEDEDEYYRVFKATGGNAFLRRVQASKLSILIEMKTKMNVLLSALSEFDFGFRQLQAICRTITIPVSGEGG